MFRILEVLAVSKQMKVTGELFVVQAAFCGLEVLTASDADGVAHILSIQDQIGKRRRKGVLSAVQVPVSLRRRHRYGGQSQCHHKQESQA